MKSSIRVEQDRSTGEWLVTRHDTRPGWRGFSVLRRFEAYDQAGADKCAQEVVEARQI